MKIRKVLLFLKFEEILPVDADIRFYKCPKGDIFNLRAYYEEIDELLVKIMCETLHITMNEFIKLYEKY